MLPFPVVSNADSCVDYIISIEAQALQHNGSDAIFSNPFSQFVDVLGQPNKTNMPDGNIENKWICPEDEKSMLYVITKADGSYESISGTATKKSGGIISFGVSAPMTGEVDFRTK